MKERADSPTEVSQIDLNRPNPDIPGDTDVDSYATRQETLDALQANDAEKMTPDEANELNEEEE